MFLSLQFYPGAVCIKTVVGLFYQLLIEALFTDTRFVATAQDYGCLFGSKAKANRHTPPAASNLSCAWIR
jgi:hypothetical protein